MLTLPMRAAELSILIRSRSSPAPPAERRDPEPLFVVDGCRAPPYSPLDFAHHPVPAQAGRGRGVYDFVPPPDNYYWECEDVITWELWESAVWPTLVYKRQQFGFEERDGRFPRRLP